MILGVIGFSDSGKTTLIERLIGALRKEGFEVCTVKHAHGEHFLSPAGKDTTRHLQAGAGISVGISKNDMAIYIPRNVSMEEAIDMIHKLAFPDVILVEGFKDDPVPKVALEGVDGKNIIARGNPDELFEAALTYIRSEVKVERVLKDLAGLNCGKCGHPTCLEMARSIVAGNARVDDCKALGSRTTIEVDGENVPVNRFVGEIIGNAIEGMVTALKGADNPRTIVIKVMVSKENLSHHPDQTDGEIEK